MNNGRITLNNRELTALPSGALWWPDAGILCVSDLHLGKSERMARRSGSILPPYETRDTLARLSDDLDHCNAHTVICLGDSFDDAQAAEALNEHDKLWITRLQAGREWIWIEGNHDPGPVALGGSHLGEFQYQGLTFRHIADPAENFEISGHYHPKVQIQTRIKRLSRRAFLYDETRLIMPAYGTYTGGLFSHDPALSSLMSPDAQAVLLGPTLHHIPMPRG
jgi:DNA ligase-associated metallophosphoesterase